MLTSGIFQKMLLIQKNRIFLPIFIILLTGIASEFFYLYLLFLSQKYSNDPAERSIRQGILSEKPAKGT